MAKQNVRSSRRDRRKKGMRKTIRGTQERPRLTVFRSLTHIYAQVINDIDGQTLVAASSLDQRIEKGSNVAAATTVGKALAEKAKAAGISKVQFDRNGYRYHGRVKALADGAREAGLEF